MQASACGCAQPQKTLLIFDGSRSWRAECVRIRHARASDRDPDSDLQDELEGTLRGHIGLIEEALDRLEGRATEADRGKKM